MKHNLYFFSIFVMHVSLATNFLYAMHTNFPNRSFTSDHNLDVSSNPNNTRNSELFPPKLMPLEQFNAVRNASHRTDISKFPITQIRPLPNKTLSGFGSSTAALPRFYSATDRALPFESLSNFEYNLGKCHQILNSPLSDQFEAKLSEIDFCINQTLEILDACLNPYNNNMEKLLDFISITIPEPTLNKILLDTKKQLCNILFNKHGNPLIPRDKKLIQKCIDDFNERVVEWMNFQKYSLANEIKNPTHLNNFLKLNNKKLYQKITNNKLNIDLLKLRDLCNQGKFEEASQILIEHGKNFFGIVRNSNSSDEYSIMRNIYQTAYRKLYDEHGINMRYCYDPKYRQIAAQLPYSDIPVKNEFLNWEERAQIKDNLLKLIGLASSPLNDTIAYTVLDLEKEIGRDAAAVFLLKQDTYRDWCTREGLPKWYTFNDNPAKKITLPSKIIEHTHIQERETFYHLATLDISHPITAAAYKQGIAFLQKSLSNDVNAKAYGTLSRATALAAKYESADTTILECQNLLRTVPEEYKEIASKIFPLVAEYADQLMRGTELLTQDKINYQKSLKSLDNYYGLLHTNLSPTVAESLKSIAQQVQNNIVLQAKNKNEDLPAFHELSSFIKPSQRSVNTVNGFTLVSPHARFAPTKKSSSQSTEFKSQFRIHEFTQERIDAHKGNTELFSATYELTKNGLQLLKSNNINPEPFKQLTGNSLQHEMQLELVDVVNHAGKFDIKASDAETKIITSGIAHTANAANHYKIQKEFTKAAVLISFCKNTVVYLEAAGSGFVDAGKDFGEHLWNQPLETLGRLGMNLIPANRLVTVYRMGRFAMEAIKFDLSQVPHIDNQELTFGKIKTGIHDAVIAISEKLYHLTTPDGIRKLTKAGASLVIEYKAANAMRDCISVSANRMNLLQTKIKLPASVQQRTPIAVTPEGIEIFHHESNNNNYFKNETSEKNSHIPKGSGLAPDNQLTNIIKDPNRVIKSIEIPNNYSGIIKKFDIIEKMADHTFSPKHVNAGINNLGESQIDILSKMADLIIKADMVGGLKEKSNQIFANINGIDLTIRCYIENGKIMTMDSFVGIATRIIGNLVDLR